MLEHRSIPEGLGSPMRQSYVAVLLIAYKLYKLLIRQLFPFILIFLFGGGSSNKRSFLFYTIIAVAVLGFIFSIIAFLKYYFWLEDGKLIIHSGVFKKTKTEIPFDRIQSVNFEQNVIHRAFNVVMLNMDTAGSAGTELQINALNRETAQQISDYIIAQSSVNQAQSDGSSEEKEIAEKKKEIFHLPIAQLLKVGITENHLRSGGIIILFFIWIFDNLREVGIDIEAKIEEQFQVQMQEGDISFTEVIQTGLFLVVSLILLFIIVSFLISLVRTVLIYYNLKMLRLADGFVVISGLLNRKEHAAKDSKIQVFSWSQNLLQKWSKIYEVGMKQASSVAAMKKSHIRVKGLEWENVRDTQAYLFKDTLTELSEMPLYGVHKYYRFKRVYYWSIFLLPVIFGSYYSGAMKFLVGASLFYIYGLVSSFLSYRKKKWGISDNALVVRGGVFGHSASMMEIYKVQNVRKRSTPFQRRRSLATLDVFSASGKISLPEISDQLATDMQNYIAYKVESSRKSWM